MSFLLWQSWLIIFTRYTILYGRSWDTGWGWSSVGGKGHMPPYLRNPLEWKGEGEEEGRRERRKRKGSGRSRREMCPTPRHKSWIRGWILVMPLNYVSPEGLVVNKLGAFCSCYTVRLSSNKLFVGRLIVVLLRLEAARGYTKNYLYLEVNLNYLLLSRPVGPLDIITLDK